MSIVDNATPENNSNLEQTTEPVDPSQTSQVPDESAEPTDVPAYEPNFKFRVRNEEREFDEWARPVIKDKETEEKLRDLYTRAHGLEDVVKNRDELSRQHNHIVGQLTEAGTLLNKGRVFDAMQVLGIPQKAIFQAVIEKLQYDELPADQKRLYDERRQAQMDAERSQSAESEMNRRYQDAILDLRQTQLQTALAEPQVQEVAAGLSKALASRGLSFEDLVIREGALEYQLTGRDISVNEAIKRVVDHYQPLLSQSSPAPSPQETVVRKTTPKSIPNLGRAPAPTKAPKARTLADLEKLSRLSRASE